MSAPKESGGGLNKNEDINKHGEGEGLVVSGHPFYHHLLPPRIEK